MMIQKFRMSRKFGRTERLYSKFENIMSIIEGLGSLALVIDNNSQILIATVKGHNLSIKIWSPDGHEIVTACDYICVDKIDKIEVSPDGSLIMSILYSRNAIQIFSIPDSKIGGIDDVWKCRINEGIAGMVNAIWSPCSSFVITESDYGIHLCFWALFETPPMPQSKASVTEKNAKKGSSSVLDGASTSIYVINSPKSAAQCGSTLHTSGALYAFSPSHPSDNFLFAVVHRFDLQDYIALYGRADETNSLQELCKFRSRSSDVALLRWSTGSGPLLIAADSPLSYRLAVYSPAGDCMCFFEAYQHALGLRCLGIGHGAASALLSAGSFDGTVRILSLSSGQLAFELPLDGTDGKGSGGVSCWEQQPSEGGSSTFVRRKIKTLPRLAVGAGQGQGGLPAMGVSWLSWSSSGRLLAAREESRPRCLWIWRPLGGEGGEGLLEGEEERTSLLAGLLLLSEPLQCTSWSPYREDRPDLLAFATTNGALFLWVGGEGVSVSGGAVRLPQSSSSPSAVLSLQWAEIEASATETEGQAREAGLILLARSKDSFLIVSRETMQEVVLQEQIRRREAVSAVKKSQADSSHNIPDSVFTIGT